MELAEKENCCLFCKNKFEEKRTVVYPKGLENISRITKKNNEFELQEEIRKKSRTGEAILVHADCENDSHLNEKVLIHNLQTVKS